MLDIAFALILAVGCYKGYSKGLIVAIFSILAFIIGMAAALKLSVVAANWLGSNTNLNAKWLPVISFTVVFLVTTILVRMGAKLIEKTFKMAMLGWVNRIGGIVFFVMLYTIILSIALFYVEKIQLIKPETLQATASYKFIKPWGPIVLDSLGTVIPIFKNMFTDLQSFFEGISNKIPK
jgi:membrane protein required for colicin V production